jgi:hypothetical protein
MHGPRLSGRREPPKTVIFNERCDVIEFERDEEDPSDDSVDEYGDGDDQDTTPDGSDPFFAPQEQPAQDSSYESIDLSEANGSLLPDTPMPLALDLDPDASITGLVDAMFAPVSGTSTPPHQQQQQHSGSAHTRTFEVPPPDRSREETDHATDLDTEDGVPFGRSHHAARAAAFHEHAAHPPPVPPPHLTPSASRPLPRPDLGAPSDMATPSRQRAGDNIDAPLGRTTHFERRLAAHEEYDETDDPVAEDVARLPGSPSPAPARHPQPELVEIGMPRFSLPSGTCLLDGIKIIHS